MDPSEIAEQADPQGMTALTQDFTLGEPSIAGPLAVYPISGPPARLAYRAFMQAIDLGAFATELPSGALVGELLIENPTDLPLLAYEGEEVLGAQQNRIFDGSALVPAGERVDLPVTCVEQGRWDSRRHADRFRPSPQAADPGLRRAKRVAVQRYGRPDRGEVWREVDARLEAHDVDSPGAALSDVYDACREDLASLAGALDHVEGQVGAVVCVSGRPVAVDLVSRPEVFAALLAPLARGYALHALGAPDGSRDDERAAAFLGDALAAARYELPTPGIGRAFAARGGTIVGAGLEHDGELIQLSAFPHAAAEVETGALREVS